MTSQRLEGDLTGILKDLSSVYYLKLQVNLMAHHPMPADYIVLSDNKNVLIECKECRGKRFDFDRLSQLYDLLMFSDKLKRNYSFVLICFWKGRKDKSLYYLIDIKSMESFINTIGKKSANEKDFISKFTPMSFNELCLFLKRYFNE